MAQGVVVELPNLPHSLSFVSPFQISDFGHDLLESSLLEQFAICNAIGGRCVSLVRKVLFSITAKHRR